MEAVLAILIVGAVVLAVFAPMLLRTGTPAAGPPDGPGGLDDELAGYRAALRAGTLCRRCYRANPPGSRFCAECGRSLAEAKPPDDE